MATVSRSQRRRRRKQKVPHLVGLQVRDAHLVLRHRGFHDPSLDGTPQEGEPQVDVRYVKNFAPYGTVVAQEPTKGQISDSDTVVRLTVSMESLLDYLPAIYRRTDVMGGNFVNDFLWIFQDIFHSIESKIDVMWTYFDVFESPDEFLPWLASWVDFSLDGEWDRAQRRLFLKQAVELYRIRGTVKGLKTFLKMYTGVEAEIIENAWPLDGFCIGVASTIGVDSAILPPTNRAHCFIVEVPLDPDTLEDDEIIKIHQIISQEKPAHTAYYLRFTGEKETGRSWVGPVIGAYRVTSADMVAGKQAEVEVSSRKTGEAEALTDEERQARREARLKTKAKAAKELSKRPARQKPEAAPEKPKEEPAAEVKETAAERRARRKAEREAAKAAVESAETGETKETKETAAERRARRQAEREAMKAKADSGADEGKKETAAERRARRKAEQEAAKADADTSADAKPKKKPAAKKAAKKPQLSAKEKGDAEEKARARRARRRKKADKTDAEED